MDYAHYNAAVSIVVASTKAMWPLLLILLAFWFLKRLPHLNFMKGSSQSFLFQKLKSDLEKGAVSFDEIKKIAKKLGFDPDKGKVAFKGELLNLPPDLMAKILLMIEDRGLSDNEICAVLESLQKIPAKKSSVLKKIGQQNPIFLQKIQDQLI